MNKKIAVGVVAAAVVGGIVFLGTKSGKPVVEAPTPTPAPVVEATPAPSPTPTPTATPIATPAAVQYTMDELTAAFLLDEMGVDLSGKPEAEVYAFTGDEITGTGFEKFCEYLESAGYLPANAIDEKEAGCTNLYIDKYLDWITSKVAEVRQEQETTGKSYEGLTQKQIDDGWYVDGDGVTRDKNGNRLMTDADRQLLEDSGVVTGEIPEATEEEYQAARDFLEGKDEDAVEFFLSLKEQGYDLG